MATLESMMGRLSVADNTTPQDPQQYETILRIEGLELVRVAKQIVQNAESFMQNLDIGGSLDEKLSLLDALDGDGSSLANIVAWMHRTTEDLVTAHVSSLGKPNPEIHKLLAYFKPQLRAIVGDVLRTTGDGRPKLLGILEECYKHSLDDSGTLCCNAYLDVLEEEDSKSPYDSDYESDQYYGYENFSQVDEDYVADIEGEYMRRDIERLEERKHTKRTWIDFWSQALQKCPGGPTLFVPTIIHDIDDLPPTPRYLFRAFDSGSSGLSNDTVVASAASISSVGINQDNILSLSPEQASWKLFDHLKNHHFHHWWAPDNLVSWSNSLFFVIQYAIWRSERRGWCPSEVHICAIDTSRFPKGQFARDMWLIEKCHNDFWRDNPLKSLTQLRKRRGYYHGEHLSQGTVNHKGRSCVFSLQDLIDAGLCELYPELDDLEGRKRWTNRVIALRSMWAERSSTTQAEIYLALQMARSCFHGMATLDIALIFLTFKNRKVLVDTEVTRVKTGNRTQQIAYGIQEPEDVQRYINTRDGVQSRVEDCHFCRVDRDILRYVFDCV